MKAARRLLADTPGETAFLHRDLANLLVHLELRSLQGLCPAARARACADAVVDGYAPSLGTWQRVPAYALTTRLRLAAVYAFRPGSAGIGLALLTDPWDPTDQTKERR